MYQIEFGGRIVVSASGKREGEERFAPLVDLIFNSRFSFQEPSGKSYELDAEGPWDLLAALFTLRHCRISSGEVTRDSSICVEFVEGFQLRANSGERYENWEVTGPRSVKVVGLPGGAEPAIWSGKTDQG